MKKKILAFLLCVLILVCPVISACQGTDYVNSEPLTFYCVNQWDGLVEFLNKYNKYCAINDMYDYRVEYVNFENYAEMEAQLSTELMAGEGPDIISLDQSLPFEKLVKNGSLMDINEIVSEYGEDFSFDDYNQIVMDAGVFDDKRYLLPLYYIPDFLATSQERCEALGVDPEKISFDYLIENYNYHNPDYYLMYPYDAQLFYCSFVKDFIDFENEETYFETDEFKTLADKFRTMVLYGGSLESTNEYDPEKDGDAFLFAGFESKFGGGNFGTVSRIYSNRQQYIEDFEVLGLSHANLLIYPNYSRNGNLKACVNVGLGINANCQNLDKAMCLIEYLLSFDAQSYWAGGRENETISYDFNLAGLPVNNEVFEASFNNALDEYYDERYSEERDKNYEEIFCKKNKFLTEVYRPMLDKITECELYPFLSYDSYLVHDVIGPIVEDYLKDDITTDNFAQKLSDAVNLYITE